MSDFALAMLMKMGIFHFFPLDYEDFKSRVSRLCHFMMILSTHNEKSRIFIAEKKKIYTDRKL